MPRPLLACCLAFAALPLEACQPQEIEVSLRRVDGRWVAALSQGAGLFSRGKTPCIEFVDLDREDGEVDIVNIAAPPPIWSIHATDGRCVDLGTFTVGATPAGFTQQTPLPAATHGRYRLTVRGIGSGNAMLTL